MSIEFWQVVTLNRTPDLSTKVDAPFCDQDQNLRLVHNNNLATACHLNSERNSETEIQPHSKHLNI